jgi:hypothetical protein
MVIFDGDMEPPLLRVGILMRAVSTHEQLTTKTGGVNRLERTWSEAEGKIKAWVM